MKKVVLLGCNGMLGRELYRIGLLQPIQDIALYALSYPQVDYFSKTSILGWLQAIEPEYIINAVAFTKVDEAETNPTRSYELNVQWVEWLAEYSSTRCQIVHFSSNYVFSGESSAPYSEEVSPQPGSVYARHKYQSETLLRQADCPAFIFRTAALYGDLRRDFIGKVLKKAMEREAWSCVCDQVIAPTPASWLASIVWQIVRYPLALEKGVYHITCAGATSWYQLAQHLLSHYVTSPCKTQPIPIFSNQPGYRLAYPAIRPLNGILSCVKLESCLRISFPHWQDLLPYYLSSVI